MKQCFYKIKHQLEIETLKLKPLELDGEQISISAHLLIDDKWYITNHNEKKYLKYKLKFFY